MKNIVTERELERMVKRVVREEKLNNINEDLPRRERERHQTQFAKSKFEPYDREREIMGAFGPYRDDLPPNIISYLRKNPRRFLQKMVDIYGMDKILDFIGYQQPEMMEGYDNYMDESNSILTDIHNDVMELPTDEAMEYLDEVIEYCVNLQSDIESGMMGGDTVGFYDNYMGSKKGKKLTASDIKSKMDSLSGNRR